MTGAGEDRATLEARNAAIKEQVSGLLDKFHQQTAILEQAQEAASSTTATVTSEDGSVTITVDASGAMTSLDFATKNFQRTDPQKLSQTVIETLHTASTQVKKQMADLVAPATEDLPDLPDLIEGAPSLKGLMPEIPDFTEQPAPGSPSPRRIRRRPVSPDAARSMTIPTTTCPAPGSWEDKVDDRRSDGAGPRSRRCGEVRRCG